MNCGEVFQELWQEISILSTYSSPRPGSHTSLPSHAKIAMYIGILVWANPIRYKAPSTSWS
jgi:hypothetical protein